MNGVYYFFILFACFMLWLKFAEFRVFCSAPFKDFFYGIIDYFLFFAYRKYNLCPVGSLVCYSGLFGKGKTLSAVHELRRLYRRYNNKKVYDIHKKKYITQYVHILSNVVINDVSYEHLSCVSQIIQQAYKLKELDNKQDTRTILLVLIDEASVVLNSRNFKGNFNADFLNTLLTSRHYNLSIFYTSQRFNLTDKLLRDVTQQVIDCRKLWRLQGLYYYDAWELENAFNPLEVLPKRKGGFFVRNADYHAYDTLATVSNLKKSFDNNDFLSDSEILTLRQSTQSTQKASVKGLKGLVNYLRS